MKASYKQRNVIAEETRTHALYRWALVRENCERTTTWRAGRHERHGFAVESGDRTGMA